VRGLGKLRGRRQHACGCQGTTAEEFPAGSLLIHSNDLQQEKSKKRSRWGRSREGPRPLHIILLAKEANPGRESAPCPPTMGRTGVGSSSSAPNTCAHFSWSERNKRPLRRRNRSKGPTTRRFFLLILV